jgi:hypothetical protein
LPADNAPIASGEMRGQFQAIQNNFDDIRSRLISLTPLGLTVSDPPTQAGLQAIADRLDALLSALSGTPRRGVRPHGRFGETSLPSRPSVSPIDTFQQRAAVEAPPQPAVRW